MKYLNLLLAALLVMSSCTDEKETPNGMKYKVLRERDGARAKTGQVLVFHYVLKDDKDSVWTDTWGDGIPAFQPVSDSSNIAGEDGMRQMLRTLSVGDSVTTSLTVAKFFRELVGAPAPVHLDTNQMLTYIISPVRITSPQEYLQMRAPLVARRDSLYINKFIEKNQLTVQTDSSGLRYILHNSSNSRKPKTNECVEVKYMGRLMRTGRIFDSAERAAFPVNRYIIPGWQLGIPRLGIGDSATFFVPSKLAYGREGYPGVIPPDAILVFDITLLDVKQEFDQKTRTCK